MAKFAKQSGIKVFYYIAPKVWAWKESRVHKLRAFVDMLFIIFPFEVEYFKRWNVPAFFSGNPLIDSVNDFLINRSTEVDFRKENNLDERPIVSVLAGSRLGEISYILPRLSFLATAYPQYQFVVAGAPSLDWKDYNKYMGPNLKWVKNKTLELMSHSLAAVVASGTATLEAALLGVPQVVCYGGSEISYQIAKRLVKGVKYISLVNLILDQECVKELIQHDMNQQRIQSEFESLLPGGSKRETMERQYMHLREILGGTGASFRVANEMVRLLKQDQHV
jgi:lipid-A-disaccharide synthase